MIFIVAVLMPVAVGVNPIVKLAEPAAAIVIGRPIPDAINIDALIPVTEILFTIRFTAPVF